MVPLPVQRFFLLAKPQKEKKSDSLFAMRRQESLSEMYVLLQVSYDEQLSCLLKSSPQVQRGESVLVCLSGFGRG